LPTNGINSPRTGAALSMTTFPGRAVQLSWSKS